MKEDIIKSVKTTKKEKTLYDIARDIPGMLYRYVNKSIVSLIFYGPADFINRIYIVTTNILYKGTALNWEFHIDSQYNDHRKKPHFSSKRKREKKSDVRLALFVPLIKFKYSSINAIVVELVKQHFPITNLIVYDTHENSFKEVISLDLQGHIRTQTHTPETANRVLKNIHYVLFLDEHGIMEPECLNVIFEKLKKNRFDLAYTDEDMLDYNGDRIKPKFKPDWSPDYLLQYNYIGNFFAVKKALLGSDPAAVIRQYFIRGSHYFLIGLIPMLIKICHIKSILYHAPFKTSSVGRYHREALKQYIDCSNINARVIRNYRNVYNIQYLYNDTPEVAIIIPFKDKVEYLRTCINSILRKTDYSNYRIMLINNGSVEEITARYLERIRNHDRITILDYPHPFNYSAINNFAAIKTSAPYLLFLNNDTEVRNTGWLSCMLEHVRRPGIGCVGAKLIFTNKLIQHAGVIFDFSYQYPAGLIFRLNRANARGYMNRLICVQNYSAVTAACLMMRRDIFFEAGMFDRKFKVAYNDLDLCCKIIRLGYSIIWTPDARLIHHENITRGNPLFSELDLKERNMFHRKWSRMFKDGDPFYTRHLGVLGKLRLKK